jgi:hypothetical protein
MRTSSLALGLTLVAAACSSDAPTGTIDEQAIFSGEPRAASAFATGLNNPRGIVFGPDGDLYVAEAGIGGARSTVGACPQVPPPLGPHTGGLTAQVVKVDPSGKVTSVSGDFPSTIDTQGAVLGVADVAFVEGQLYALIAGGGCGHGLAEHPNGVARIESNGEWSYIADLSAYYKANPTARPGPDFDPEGVPYSMISAVGSLWVVEANHGSVERVHTDGVVDRIGDVSAIYGHIVPTSIAFFENIFHVGALGTFPAEPGGVGVASFRIGHADNILDERLGATAVVDVVVHKRKLFALETFTCPSEDPCFPSPFTGRVVVWQQGAWVPVVTGLAFPTAMTFGPDGMLYISTWGYGAGEGGGMIERVRL